MVHKLKNDFYIFKVLANYQRKKQHATETICGLQNIKDLPTTNIYFIGSFPAPEQDSAP